MLIILLYTYDEQARSEKDILEADNGYSAKNWERGRAFFSAFLERKWVILPTSKALE